MNPLSFRLKGPKSTFRLVIDNNDSVLLQDVDLHWVFYWGPEDDCSPENDKVQQVSKWTGHDPDMISGLVAQMRGAYETMRGYNWKESDDVSSAVRLARSVGDRLREKEPNEDSRQK